MNSPIIRMYVDENGHQNLNGDLSNLSKRFLCLTGVIMPIEHHDQVLTPALENLKLRFFHDSTVNLHRRDIISAEGVFACLSNEAVRLRFNQDLLEIISNMQYRVISVVIDKYALVEKYGILHAQDPYALALEYLMQRYLYWMEDYASRNRIYEPLGDILAEARGGGEDILTKRTYQEIFAGRGYNPLKDTEKYYTSSQIKLKPKSANIAGLQFVDLISHPARRYILSMNGFSGIFKTSSFESEIAKILVKSKFRRNRYTARIDGIGTVFFPKK